jgi:hypothetical protein
MKDGRKRLLWVLVLQPGGEGTARAIIARTVGKEKETLQAPPRTQVPLWDTSHHTRGEDLVSDGTGCDIKEKMSRFGGKRSRVHPLAYRGEPEQIRMPPRNTTMLQEHLL